MSDPASYDPRAVHASSASLDDLKALWGRANDSVEAKRILALRPTGRKSLRQFTLAETLDLLGIYAPVFYEFTRDKPHLQGAKVSNNQRLFTLETIQQLRAARLQMPRQRLGIERAFCIAIANFKGGVAKTFTTATLGQYFALQGYRTLLIDLDPQASLSTTFGLNVSETDTWQTVLPYFYGRAMIEKDGGTWPESFRESIQKTYWYGLDLVAANLQLAGAEFVLTIRRDQEPGFQFHRPLYDALEDVRGDYDVILIDTPPSLGLSTTCALYAADGLIVPTQAELLDYESARAFIKLSTEIMGGLKTIYGDDKLFDLFRVLITRYKTSQAAVVKDILEVFGPYCLPEPMVDSAAVSRQMGEFTTLYEADPRAAGRVALKRARAAANDVNRLIENVLVDIFKQRRAQRARAAKQVA